MIVEKMRNKVNILDIEGLKTLWEKLTGYDIGERTLRGLIMDRLEAMNPTAFDLWLDDNDWNLYK